MRIAVGSIGRRGSAAPVLEQDGLEIRRSHAARRSDERPDLPTSDEPPSTELDALQAARPRPAADRGRCESDVGRSQDPGRLGKGDPVGRGRHLGQSVVVAVVVGFSFF